MSTPEAEPAPKPPNPPGSPRPAKAKQSVPISVFLGILLVPLSAAASMYLVSPQVEESTAAPSETSVAVVATEPSLQEDVRATCGPIGLEMIELEKAGSLTELQRAALDALRPICAQQGMPLPETSAQGQTVQAVPAPNPSPVGGASSTGSDDGRDDDDWDDDDWDDDDWDDDDWDDDDWDDSDDSLDSDDDWDD